MSAVAFDQTRERSETAQHSVQSQLGGQVMLGIDPVQLTAHALGPHWTFALSQVVMVPLHITSHVPPPQLMIAALHESFAVHSTAHA